MILPWLLAAIPMAAAARVPIEGALHIDFEVFRGNNAGEMGPNRQASLVKRDGLLLMEVENASTFYKAELKIGLELQEVGVLVDTGSSDLWVMSTDVTCGVASSSKKRGLSPLLMSEDSDFEATKVKREMAKRCSGLECFSALGFTTITISPDATSLGSSQETDGAETNTCTSYGLFETADLDTFHRNTSVSDFSIEYADSTSATGIWGYDTVQVGGTNVSDLSLAVVNASDSGMGVLGIGLPGLEVTYSLSLDSYMYENLPMKLRSEGLIHKKLYSLYLNSDSATTGSVLFGAVDHAKYSGTLQTVPIINIYSEFYSHPIRLDVVLSGITFQSDSINETVSTSNYAALLDSGTTLTYLPLELLTNLVTIMLATYSETEQFYQVDCSYSSDTAFVVYHFLGITIKVPLLDLVLSYGSDLCYLGVLEQTSETSTSVSYAVLGDNFLRSAYVVYDLEDYQVSMAQASYLSSEDIEVVSSSVPSAVLASGYSLTSLSTALSDSSVTAVSSSNLGSKKSGAMRHAVSVAVMVGALGVFSLF